MAELSVIGFDSFQETTNGFITHAETPVHSHALTEVINRYRRQANIVYRLDEIKKENWNKKWEASYQPIVVEKRCIVRASFHQPEHHYQIEIIIDPRMSFGTGHHETTYLMLAAQLDLDHNNKVVLDAGCGTGILSILAGKLKARKIIAYDNDKWVIKNVQENLTLNNTSAKVHLGTIQTLNLNTQFDIILANINKNILVADIPYYSNLLMPDGDLLLSGFYLKDIEDIRLLAENNSLSFIASKTRNDWAMAHFKKF